MNLSIKNSINIILIILQLIFINNILANDTNYYKDEIKLLNENNRNIYDSRYELGIFSHYSLNFHSTNFKKIDECPSCSPGYKFGIGNKYSYGIIFEKIFNKTISAEIKLAYYDLGAIIKTKELSTIIIDGEVIPAVIEHSINSKFPSISMYLGGKYNVRNSFYLSAGLKFDNLLNGEFIQKEELISPKESFFIDENGKLSKSRNMIKDKFKLLNKYNLSPFIKLSYKYHLKNNYIIEPEIIFSNSLFNLVEGNNLSKWKLYSVNLGFSFKYNLKKKNEDKFLQIFKIDTVIIEKEALGNEYVKVGNTFINKNITYRVDTLYKIKQNELYAEIKSYVIDEDSNKKYDYLFKIEEIEQSKYEPLLPYIFFDENSYEIQKQYIKIEKNKVNEFNINDLFINSTIEVYYNILNIIGKRLREYPNSILTIIGCNSSIGIEKNNLELSRNRAEKIKNYLENIWEIDPKRLIPMESNLPKLYSTPLNEIEKQEENRRVEFYCTNPKVLEPIYIEYINKISNYEKIYFEPIIKTNLGVDNYRISAFQENNKSLDYEYENSLIDGEIYWDISKKINLINNDLSPIYYSLTVKDLIGNAVKSSVKSINIDYISIKEKITKKIDNYKIENYKLILFDFDKATIDKQNSMILDFIKSKIKDNSIVEIKGYTDRTGEANYNKELSLKRAEIVYKAINKKDAIYQGLGEEYPLFDNDLPEGRFYNRTIDILIKTLISND